MSSEDGDSFVLTPTAAGDLVDSLRQDWTVTSVSGVAGSLNSVYEVTVADGGQSRPLVCKCCQGSDPASFRVEPALLAAITEETTVPVPAVVEAAVDHPAIDGPVFVLEGCQGEDVSDGAADLALSVAERIAADAGANLAEIHRLGDFDRFGTVRLADDVAHDRVGLRGPLGDLTVEDDAAHTWREWFEVLVEGHLDTLDERFADLESPIREYVTARLDRLDDVDPVLTKNDYWYFNLLVNPDSGETEAVLDFETSWTADAAYNLAVTIDGLSALAPLGSERRRRVREALYDGYSQTRELTRDQAFRDRRALYRVAARLPPLAHFESHTAGKSAERTAVIAAESRAFVKQCLDASADR